MWKKIIRWAETVCKRKIQIAQVIQGRTKDATAGIWANLSRNFSVLPAIVLLSDQLFFFSSLNATFPFNTAHIAQQMQLLAKKATTKPPYYLHSRHLCQVSECLLVSSLYIHRKIIAGKYSPSSDLLCKALPMQKCYNFFKRFFDIKHFKTPSF